ncbi:hypothetical protein FGG08_000623 [Glutinoglossum americanum]|uniref:Uncharacterized protein n=1 Tax=Glutinoglossum americanum TaxID=1670608 RepID=A0A9P8L5Z6_9PEZI|nr:hypothetical protein FGG08_000623 [Glutinoglossum americanum]
MAQNPDIEETEVDKTILTLGNNDLAMPKRGDKVEIWLEVFLCDPSCTDSDSKKLLNADTRSRDLKEDKWIITMDKELTMEGIKLAFGEKGNVQVLRINDKGLQIERCSALEWMVTLEGEEGSVSRPSVGSELIVDYWIWETENGRPDNNYKGNLFRNKHNETLVLDKSDDLIMTCLRAMVPGQKVRARPTGSLSGYIIEIKLKGTETPETGGQ